MNGRVGKLLYLVVLILVSVVPAMASIELAGEFKHQILVREDLVLTTAKTGGIVSVWDIDRERNGKVERPSSTLDSGLSSIETLQVSPDGRYFAITGSRDDSQKGKLAAIRVYSADGRLQHSFTSEKATDPPALVVFDDWRWMAFYVGGDLGKIDLRTGRQVLYRRDRSANIDSLSISPDGDSVSILSGGKITAYTSRDEERQDRRNRD